MIASAGYLPKTEINKFRDLRGIKPKTLYKYRDWNDPFHKRMLIDGEIYFASPSRFNDPFDCAIAPDFSGTKTQKVELHAELSCLRDPSLSKAKALQLADEEWDRVQPYTPEKIEQMLERHRQYIDEKVGVFSLSETCSDILMWSHYANSHCGICIGFDVDSLINLLAEFLDTTSSFSLDLEPVEYSESYPEWNFFGHHLNDILEMFSKTLITKSQKWADEKEWRMVMVPTRQYHGGPLGNERLVRLPECAISEIYLGLNMQPESKDEIGTIVAKRGTATRVMEATKSKRDFSLEFKELV